MEQLRKAKGFICDMDGVLSTTETKFYQVSRNLLNGYIAKTNNSYS